MTGKGDAQSPAQYHRINVQREDSTVPLRLAYDRTCGLNPEPHAAPLRMPTHPDVFEWLDGRVGPLHLRQRLGIEADQEALVFGRGIKFFHLENWYSVHAVIRAGLRFCGLLGRARQNAMSIELRHHQVHIPDLPRSPGELPWEPDLIVADVSFISLHQGAARGARAAARRGSTASRSSSRSSRSGASASGRGGVVRDADDRRGGAGRRGALRARRAGRGGARASPRRAARARPATARASSGWPRRAAPGAVEDLEAAARRAEP